MTSTLPRVLSMRMSTDTKRVSTSRMVDNPLHNDIEINRIPLDKDHDDHRIKDMFGQMDMPWRVKQHVFDPTFYKCDSKVVKYDAPALSIWRALVSFSHTIISDRDTWLHLLILGIICVLTTVICYESGAYRSVYDDGTVTSRIQVLISFVFASYISLIISRWDRIRNTTLAQAWTAIEHICLMTFQTISRQCKDRKEEEELSFLLIRYCRLCFQLLFKSMQHDEDLSTLQTAGLLTPMELKYLRMATLLSRPLVVIGWMNQYFEDLRHKYKFRCNDVFDGQVANNLMNLRNGILTTQSCIDTQLPYPYVHAIYWTIQVLLAALSIETGVMLATCFYTQRTGDGDYSPPSGDTWPVNRTTWYVNNMLEITVTNIIFALFCEGLLKVCQKLNNPMSKKDTSFSERVFGKRILILFMQ
eukprot:scaffold2507_cov257-Ochromonas_danica.AAC.3